MPTHADADPPSESPPWVEPPRSRRTLVVVDVVESVRLMLTHESDVIERWRRFVDEVVQQVLPRHAGRLVKSLGDGMLLEFEAVPQALAAVFDMQARMPAYNVGRPSDAAMHLRVGAHEADVVVDKLDVFGAGVNLAARLASLAGPGEAVVSASVRDKIIPNVDAAIQDMGDCYMKHIEQPVRAFRVAPVGAAQRAAVHLPQQRALVPRLAVLPLANASDDARLMKAGESLADDLIATLSRCAFWQVTSSLSSTALAQRDFDLRAIGELLHVDFVMTGSVSLAGPHAHIKLELAEVVSGAVVWSDALSLKVENLMVGPDALAPRVSVQVMKALLRREMALAHVAAMPNLPSYALLLQAIGLMHSAVLKQAERSRETLEYLHERHPRAPDVLAWTAQWHLFHIFQRLNVDSSRVVDTARRTLLKAIDLDSSHPLSLALYGHVLTMMDRDPPKAEIPIRQALSANPNEPIAWLFLSHALLHQDRGEEAVTALEQATALSPIDPLKYFFDSFASAVYVGVDRFEDAIACADRAVRANASHLPSLAMLVISHSLAGNAKTAREVAARYLALRPSASVKSFLASHIAPSSAYAKRDAKALSDSGIPS